MNSQEFPIREQGRSKVCDSTLSDNRLDSLSAEVMYYKSGSVALKSTYQNRS